MPSLGIYRRLRRLQGPDGRFLLFAADHVRALASLGTDGVVWSTVVSRVAESPDAAAVEGFVGGLAAGLRR